MFYFRARFACCIMKWESCAFMVNLSGKTEKKNGDAVDGELRGISKPAWT